MNDGCADEAKTLQEKFLALFSHGQNEILQLEQIRDVFMALYPDTNRDAILPSDYCYNRWDQDHAACYLFEWIEQSLYKCLGVNYQYTGDMVWSGRHGEHHIIGKWINGVCYINKNFLRKYFSWSVRQPKP